MEKSKIIEFWILDFGFWIVTTITASVTKSGYQKMMSNTNSLCRTIVGAQQCCAPTQRAYLTETKGAITEPVNRDQSQN
jgi:hypothetical protein